MSDPVVHLDGADREDDDDMVERLERFNGLVRDGLADSYPPVREQLREYFDRAGL